MTSEIINFYEEKITSLYDVEKPGIPLLMFLWHRDIKYLTI